MVIPEIGIRTSCQETRERVDVALRADERTRSWLARKCDVSVSHLHRVLSGERPLTQSLAERMADVLGLQVTDLLEER